jgi:tetratricopeptide (TPR) repeat protein
MNPIKSSSAAIILCLCTWTGQSSAQQLPANSEFTASPITSQDKQGASATDLIAQGKALFRTTKLSQALAKFEAALKLEPDNDEALGLAAETAFRLDRQSAARGYFLRRADAPGQKESVKAFCYQRVAMTHWREAHDLVAKFAEIKPDGRQNKVVYSLPENSLNQAMDGIGKGIDYAARAIGLRDDFADAYNIRNLLHAEAALAATDEEAAKGHREKSLDDLRMAFSMGRAAYDSKNDIADFNQPTLRISEIPRTKTEDGQIEDPMMKVIEGGKVLKRVSAVFPTARSSKPASDPNAPANKGTVPDGGASSQSTGRSPLTGAYTAGKVKVEVLISTEGKVIFTHIVDGRSDLNAAATVAARGWTFEPAMFDGQPVQLSGVISFDLKPPTPRSTTTPAAKPPEKKP